MLALEDGVVKEKETHYYIPHNMQTGIVWYKPLVFVGLKKKLYTHTYI